MNLSARFLLILGGSLLIAYFLLGWEMEFFDLKPKYLISEQKKVNSLLDSDLRYFGDPKVVSLYLWKILLLFPGSLLLALFLIRRNVQVPLSAFLGKAFLIPFLCGGSMIAVFLIAWGVLEFSPVTDDENAFQLQAGILLDGKISGPPAPVPECFENTGVISRTVYTGKYNLGHPFLLAVGRFFYSPYLATILLAGSLVPAVFLIAKGLYGETQIAALAAFLLAVSPFFLFTSATLLSHVSSAACLWWGLLALVRLFPGGSRHRILLPLTGGLLAGYAFNIRPLTALGFGVPIFFWFAAKSMIKSDGGPPARSPLPVFLLLLGFSLPVLLTLLYNKEITGSYLRFPFHAYDPGEVLGFTTVGAYAHTPLRALNNLLVVIAKLNQWLFGIPLSLLFIAVLIVFSPLAEADLLLLFIIGSFALAYGCYYNPGVSDTGPVYYFELLLPLVILSARGMVQMKEWFDACFPTLRGFLENALVVSLMVGLATFVPESASHLSKLVWIVSEPRRLVAEAGLRNSVVFVRGASFGGYTMGYPPTSSRFDDDVIYCLALSGELNAKVVKAFPNRDYYLLYRTPKEDRCRLVKITPQTLSEFR